MKFGVAHVWSTFTSVHYVAGVDHRFMIHCSDNRNAFSVENLRTQSPVIKVFRKLSAAGESTN